MRILFISSNRIGDAVLTTGLLAHLERTCPDAHFTVVCGPVAADLFRAVPRLEALIVLKKKKHHAHWFDLWKRCVTTRWDLIVDLRNSAVTRLLFAKRKIYKKAHASGRHKVEDHADAMKLSPPPSPLLWIDAPAAAKAAAKMPHDVPVLALGPSANWPPKQWPIESFIELAKRLTAEGAILAGAKILIVAAPHERDQVTPLMNAFPKDLIIDGVGYDLLTVAAFLQRAKLFVGNDSGLMHMASAVGTPTLGLFGPGFENIYGPWGKHTAFVRTPESAATLLARLPDPAAFEPRLMDSLSVDTVVEAAEALLQSELQS